MDTYTVEVDHTDRTRHPDGRFVIVTHTVSIAATDDVDAELGAAQMVAAHRDFCVGGMVTATRITDVVL